MAVSDLILLAMAVVQIPVLGLLMLILAAHRWSKEEIIHE